MLLRWPQRLWLIPELSIPESRTGWVVGEVCGTQDGLVEVEGQLVAIARVVQWCGCGCVDWKVLPR